MHQALYRKWRPKTFNDVCGQEHITSILKYEIDNSKFSHAYLFCGSRGTGKTSCAKILSKAVNCLCPEGGNPCGKCEACLSIENGTTTDVLEMDAASNNGVDNIRDIRDEVVYAPSSLKYRVYIIDEVHMLSQSAFNALLKTLEEPPEHVVFILATTELHKLPATIISRCQRFDFRRISTDVLKNHLLHIANAEGIDLCPDAAVMLAKQAQGGMRDAISLLELCSGSREKITPELVNITIGSLGREEMLSVVSAIINKDYEEIFGVINNVFSSSRDISVFWQELISLYRDLLIIKTSKNAREYLDLTDSEIQSMSEIAKNFSREQLSYHCTMLEEGLFSMLKANSIKRIVAEFTLIKMCDYSLSVTPEALLARISALESRASFAPTAVSAEQKPANEAVSAEEKALHGADKKTVSEQRYADDDEMFRSDKPITVKKTQKAQPMVSRGSVRSLKPFRNRAEALDMLTNKNSMVASFYKVAKWYVDESGKIVLKFPDRFSGENAKLFDTANDFLSVISSVSGTTYSQNDVLYESEDKNDKPSVIDEILEQIEQD